MTIKQLFPTQRPALDLNFARQKRLDSRVTFTRASTGTYVGSDGLIKTAADNEARFDHDPATGESLGLLIEESRTNLLTRSEEFDDGAAWGKINVTVTANAVVAPDGTTTADKLSATTTNGFHSIYTASISPSISGTLSIFAKKAEYSRLIIGYTGISFNLDTGLIESTIPYLGSTAKIEQFANGWYRCSVSGTLGGNVYLSLANAAPVGDITEPPSFAGDNISGIYVWGAQIEEASFPASYIPTTSSTVTRSADVASLTNSSIYDTASFTILNEPFGSAAGASTLSLVGAGDTPIKRTAVYSQELTQTQINASVGKTDEFWRWRILGSSFGLPYFVTNGQVTVDWGDGTVETLTTSDHTFTDGGGYHEIGFRLDSGTFFRPRISNNATHKAKVVAVGPAPESMKLNGNEAFSGCSALEAFDATVDATGGTDFQNAWSNCTSLTSFPLIDTSSGTNFNYTWQNCSSLTSFPLIDTSSGTSFNTTWYDCNSLTSFPAIDTSSGTTFYRAWQSCNSLTSFPLLDTSSGTVFQQAWSYCSSLTNFPLIDTSSGTNFQQAWQNCSSLTSFPLLNTSSATSFYFAWGGCSSLTSFPLIDASNVTTFYRAWDGCSSLTNFPANFFDSWAGTPDNFCFVSTWLNCSSLTATSVENILNSIDTSGQSAPATAPDITIDYNAGTGTPNITTAVTNLKSRGWTITLNGVPQ